MKYYKDVDYFLYFEDFPHMGVPGVTALNSDGTVNIFINTLYNQTVQARTVRHELRHMVYGHFSADWMSITEKEIEADNDNGSDCIFAEDFASVEYTGLMRKPPLVRTFISREAVMQEIKSIYTATGISHMNVFVPRDSYLSKAEVERIYSDVRTACAIVKANRAKRYKKTARAIKSARR